MYQPDALKTTDYLPWSRGRGVDVWAMFEAAAKGDLASIEALVARHPALATCEFQYRTPLNFAVREQQVAVAKFLIDHGADPTIDFDVTPKGTDVYRLLAERIGYHPDGTDLAELIRQRDIDPVRHRIEADPILLQRSDERGNLPIHWAVMTRQMPLIDLLISKGADLNAKRPDGARPLNLTNGDYFYRGWRDVPSEALRQPGALIGYLIAKGANYDIYIASRIGDLERVREILDQDPDAINRIPDYCGYYNGVPVHNASGAGHPELVKFLLERGANPNQPENQAPFGGALLGAVGNGHYEIAHLLIDHGADVNGAVESSGNCLWRAQQNDAPKEVLEALISRGARLPLDIVAYDGNIELANEILGDNRPVPEDAFRQAVVENQQAFVEFLVAREPGVLKRFSFDGAPNKEFALWLLDHGHDPRPANWLGSTALHRFAGSGNLEMARLCLEHGADKTLVDDELKLTPLGWAQRKNQTALIELLS